MRAIVCQAWPFTLLLAVVSSFGSLGFLGPTLAPHLSDYGVEPYLVGLLFGLASIAYATLALLGVAMLERLGAVLLVVLGLVALATGFVLLGPSFPGMTLTVPLQLASLLLIGGGAGLCVVPITPRLLRDRAIMRLGTGSAEAVSAVVSAAGSLGEALGPIGAGFLVTVGGFPEACLLLGTGTLVIVSLILVMAIARNRCDLCSYDDAREHEVLVAGRTSQPIRPEEARVVVL